MEPPPPPEHSKPSPHRFRLHASQKFKPPEKKTGSNDTHPSKRLRVAEELPSSQLQEDVKSTAPRFMLTHSPRDPNTDRLRPSFVRSTIESDSSASPLPEVFSPHRRGQRFVAGGLAAEVQSWITDLRTQAQDARRNANGTDGLGFDIVITVSEIHGVDVVFARGVDTGGLSRGAVLVRGAGHGHGEPLHPRMRVGIREPTWTVEVAGESWIVAADWEVLGTSS